MPPPFSVFPLAAGRASRCRRKAASGGLARTRAGLAATSAWPTWGYALPEREPQRRSQFLQTEPNGLIYMKGRYYSPAWHRFLNSNQGVDPNLINQFAYTLGSVPMMTDPTGMDVGGPGGTNGPEYGFSMATPTNPTHGLSKAEVIALGKAVASFVSDPISYVAAVSNGKAKAAADNIDKPVGKLNAAVNMATFANQPTTQNAAPVATDVANAAVAVYAAPYSMPVTVTLVAFNFFATRAIPNMLDIMVSFQNDVAAVPDTLNWVVSGLDVTPGPGQNMNPNAPNSFDFMGNPSSQSTSAPAPGTGGEF